MRLNEKAVRKATEKIMKEEDHMEVTERGLGAILPQMTTKQKRNALKNLVRFGMSEEEARKQLGLKKKESD